MDIHGGAVWNRADRGKIPGRIAGRGPAAIQPQLLNHIGLSGSRPGCHGEMGLEA